MLSGNRRRLIVGASVLTLMLTTAIATACGDDDDSEVPAQSPTSSAATTPSASGSEGAVDVELLEFSVVPASDTASAGPVTFNVRNTGPEDTHEFVVIRTDLAPGALPTEDDGSVSEDGLDVVDELEDVLVGESKQLMVDLQAGSYVLICNIVEEEDGETTSHYQRGMRSAFTVE